MLTHQHSCALGDELGGDGELRAVHVRLQPVQLRVPAHPPAEAEGKAQGVLPAGGRTISLGSAPPARHPTEKTCLESSRGKPLPQKKEGREDGFGLFWHFLPAREGSS